MPTSPTRIAVAFAILAGALLAPISSFAQVTSPATFPQRTLKFVVPTPPGTSLDLLPRLLGKKLSESSGRSVIVENRPGAAGHVGAESVARAEPDGHTLLATAPGTLVLSPWLDVKLGFDPVALVPVTVLVKVPTVLVVNPKLPVKSFAEWVAYAKANPAAMAYGSPGTGSTAHLAQEELMRALGVQLLHVPYQGMGPAINDLLAGHIQTMFAATGTVLPHIDEGRLRAIAITGGHRLAHACPVCLSSPRPCPGTTISSGSPSWRRRVRPRRSSRRSGRRFQQRFASPRCKRGCSLRRWSWSPAAPLRRPHSSKRSGSAGARLPRHGGSGAIKQSPECAPFDWSRLRNIGVRTGTMIADAFRYI
jgi:tripartite-type tricarboxylate transporter receptor subunit TctC